jgi:AcrR family transcriptional regulator
MSPSATSPAVGRRTQEERREATRGALLEAILDCLLEEGYAGLTTRRVAARAGVSVATQRFYFPNRASFVAAAVEQLGVEISRQNADHPQRSAELPVRFQAWLDELWEICNGPAFLAIMELSSAARTDEDARAGLVAADHALTSRIAMEASELFPDQIGSPRFRALLDQATAAMRGLVMLLPVDGREPLERRWWPMREELMRSFGEIVGEGSR